LFEADHFHKCNNVPIFFCRRHGRQPLIA
jgi:hypothetical protein